MTPDQLIAQSSNSSNILLNGALSPYQTQLNQLLDQTIRVLEPILTDRQSSSLEVALELAPVLSSAQRSLNGTDLTQTLLALQATHQALLKQYESYLQSPVFSDVQDFLAVQMAPLQAQFNQGGTDPISASAQEDIVSSNTEANNAGQAGSESLASDALGPAHDFDSPSALNSQTPLPEALTLANLEAKVLAMKGVLEHMKDSSNLLAQDALVIDEAISSLDSQSRLLESTTTFDAGSPLVMGNLYSQFEQTSQNLRQELSAEALERLIFFSSNSIAPNDSDAGPSPAAEQGGKENPNEIISLNPADPKAVLAPHQLPDRVRAQFLATESGEFFYKDRNHALAFADTGGKIKTANADPQVASAMVAVAKAKGWGSLKLAGSPEFKAAIWLAAQLADVPTEGYKPTDLDRALLAKALDDLQSNSITQGTDPKLNIKSEQAQNFTVNTSEQNIDQAIDAKQARAMASSDQGFAGKLIDFGQAPYQFSSAKGEPLSYFVRVADASDKEHLFWGKELEDAINLAGGKAVLGQSIVLYQRGKRAVETVKIIRDAKGEIIGQEPISAMRNAWEIIRGPEPSITPSALPATTITSPIATSPVSTLDSMAKAFANRDINSAPEVIAKFPQLVHVYATQKVLFEQAALSFSDPVELANAQASINKVLAERISQGKIDPPLVAAPRYSVTVDSIFERGNPSSAQLSGSSHPGSEQVLRFVDAKNQLHELTGVDFSMLSAEQLTPGAPLTLTQVSDAADPNKIRWQASNRDPAIALHGVAAAELARSIGADDAQARSLASKVMGILQTHSESQDSTLKKMPLEAPKLKTGASFALPIAPRETDQVQPNKPHLAERNKRAITPTRAQ